MVFYGADWVALSAQSFLEYTYIIIHKSMFKYSFTDLFEAVSKANEIIAICILHVLADDLNAREPLANRNLRRSRHLVAFRRGWVAFKTRHAGAISVHVGWVSALSFSCVPSQQRCSFHTTPFFVTTWLLLLLPNGTV